MLDDQVALPAPAVEMQQDGEWGFAVPIIREFDVIRAVVEGAGRGAFTVLRGCHGGEENEREEEEDIFHNADDNHLIPLVTSHPRRAGFTPSRPPSHHAPCHRLPAEWRSKSSSLAVYISAMVRSINGALASDKSPTRWGEQAMASSLDSALVTIISIAISL